MGKLRTKITSPMAKSTSPGLSDTTFFARWKYKWAPHQKCYRCCNALSSKYSIYLESFCRHKIATIGDNVFEMLSYIYRGVFFRNHNKQRPLPPPFGQCLVDYCFPRASWLGVQHWKGERRGLGQPGKGTVGNCFKLFLIWKSLKLGHLCHFGQTVSKNFVVNCGVANKLIWLFRVKAWFPVK